MDIKESNLTINDLQIMFDNYGINNMKLNLKIKIILVLVTLGTLFAFMPIITTNLSFNAGNSSPNLMLKLSKIRRYYKGNI